jgi:hypothetical protein
MIKCKWQGRLGNIIFQSVGIRLLAIKFNLRVSDYKYNLDTIGFKKYSGENSFESTLNICDTDLVEILNKTSLEKNINYDGFFQVKDFVLNYEEEIRNSFDLTYEYQSPENIFIHVRLDDATTWNPGYEYYKKCLENVNFDVGYISSDSSNNHIVNRLINEFNLILYQNNPIDTINFAKNFNKIILSEGTFSWWIGFLSKASEIYYPKYNEIPLWHGDIFVYDDWIPVKK